MAEISKITIGTSTYDIKDAYAREQIVGGVHYVGKTNAALTDGATTKPIKIYDAETTTWVDYEQANGDVVIYEKAEGRHLEFIWNGNHWDEFGSTGELGTAAFKDYENVNLEHNHALTYASTTANVSFGSNAKTGDVVTGASLSSVDSLGDFNYVSEVKVSDAAVKPSIVVPDVINGTCTPKGSVTLGGTETETTGGAVDYETNTITSAVSVADHTVNVTGGSVTITQGTVSGSTEGVKASLAGAPVFTGTQATITPSKSSTNITVSGETLIIPASVITSVGSATYTPEGTNDAPNITVTQGTISGSTVGVSATYKNPTVTVSKHSVTNGTITLPDLTLTAPRYWKATSATFSGQSTTVSGTTGYQGNSKYALAYINGEYKEYDGNSPDAASATVSLGMAVIPKTKAARLNVTTGTVGVTGLSGSVKYDKANTPTGAALSKTITALKA